MRRKKCLIIFTVMTAACLFGACGKSADESLFQVQIQPDESGQKEVTDKKESDKKESDKEESSVNEEESSQMDVTAEKLTGQTARQEMAMHDYSIESYEAVQKFGYELLAQNIQDRNPVLSPVSAYLALAMAGCGADGTTKEEFYKVLGEEGEGILTLSYDMINTLPAKGKELNLSIADSAWIDDEFIVDDAWLGTIKSVMDAEAFHADLSTEDTMNQINHWIDDKTNGLIDKMLAEPLDEDARLALFNTVYFKGKWEIPFEAIDTGKEDFYLYRGQDEKEQVDMMNLYNTDLDYIANDFAEGVILPYQKNDYDSSNENLAFIALKPLGNNDIRGVYSRLTSEVTKDILVNKQTQLVNIKLPKFEITFDKELNGALSNMGLVECFDVNKANFDRMGKTQSEDNLYISLVRQKAKIIVDEEGTEAAAVTEVIMTCGAAMIEPQKPKEVYFNEPFIYMIMNMDKELPLFIGILDNPSL